MNCGETQRVAQLHRRGRAAAPLPCVRLAPRAAGARSSAAGTSSRPDEHGDHQLRGAPVHLRDRARRRTATWSSARRRRRPRPATPRGRDARSNQPITAAIIGEKKLPAATPTSRPNASWNCERALRAAREEQAEAEQHRAGQHHRRGPMRSLSAPQPKPAAPIARKLSVIALDTAGVRPAGRLGDRLAGTPRARTWRRSRRRSSARRARPSPSRSGDPRRASLGETSICDSYLLEGCRA